MRTPIDTQSSLRAILLLLSALLLSTSALASPTRDNIPGSRITIISRQAPAAKAVAGTVLSTAEACAQYSLVANLSAIGTNSTIRSAFLESSPRGTLFNSALLNVMEANAKLLMLDPELNQACGNLSALALQEVAVNFTMGIVGPFTFTGNPVAIVNGQITGWLTIACIAVIIGAATAV